LNFFGQTFEKYSSIKFNENSSTDSQAVARGQTGGRTDEQTRIMKLIVAFSQVCEPA